MNAPVVLAQLSGSSPQTPQKNLKLTRPQNGQAVTVHLDGQTQLDFSDIGSEKLTFVRVGDKLIVLFDNQSTVTIDPVFDASGHPLPNVAFEMASDRTLTGDQFAELFPITTDQSVLPAAGGSGPTAGAHFGDPSVDPLSTFTPLDLLGAETFGSSFGGPNDQAGNSKPNAGVADVADINEDGLGGNPGGTGDVPGPLTVTGSLHVNFGSDVNGRSFAFAADQSGLANLTSDGQAIHLLVTTTSGGLPLMIGYVGTDPTIAANQVFTISLDANSTLEGTYTFTLLRPLDHPILGTEDTLDLTVNVTAADGSGDTVSTTFHVNVNDDTPVIVAANETHSTLTDPLPHSFTFLSQTGSLGISWGADRFNDTVDGGVSATTGHTGDRSVVFADALVSATGHAGDTTGTIATLTSFGQIVHYALLDNGTVLLAYTGTVVPALPGTGTGSGDEGPHVSPNVVFVVSLSDASDSGSYVITQYQPLDHNVGAQTFDTIDLSFHFTATDSDGDPVTGTLTATVNDTVPVVSGPVGDETVAESTVSAGPVPSEVLLFAPVKVDDNSFVPATTGGSLNINWNADDNNIVNGVGSHDRGVTFATPTAPDGLTSNGIQLVYTESADGTLLTATAGAGGPTVFTVQLDDGGSGSYTFTLLDNLDHPAGNGANNLALTFSFTATDSDGDSTAPASFIVNVTDDVPTIGAPDTETVTESTTSTAANTFIAASATGSLAVDWNSDDNNIVNGVASHDRGVSFATSIHSGDAVHTTAAGSPVLTSNGVEVQFYVVSATEIWGLANDTGGALTLSDRKVFHITLSDSGDGSYTFTLLDNLDHPTGSGQNTLSLNIGFTATDSDGDVAGPSSFTVTVQDDVPVAGVGTATTIDEGRLFDGNDHGFFEPPFPQASGNLNIDWNSDDHDGGSTANRSVAFQHAVAADNVVVKDSGGNTVTGLTSDGHTVNYAFINGDLVGYTGSNPFFNHVFVVSLNDDSTGSYSFTLLGNLDHPAANGENTLTFTFDYTATDSDGDPSSNVFSVTVKDDIPAAHTGDSRLVDEDDLPNGTSPHAFELTVSGDLNISWGADDGNPTSHGGIGDRSVAFSSSTAASNVTVTDSSHHTISGLTSDGAAVLYTFIGNVLVGYTGTTPGSINASNVVFNVSLSDFGDGSYTFKLLGNLDHPADHGQNSLNFTFNYTATDGDGDTSSNSFTVTVKDDVPVIGSPTASTLTEDATGTAGAETFVTQTASNVALAINWGADNSNSGSANRSVAFSSFIDTGDTVHTTGFGSPVLTSNGVAVQFIRVSDTEIWGVANDNGGQLTLSDRQVFHITLSDSGNGSYTFVLLDNVDHLGPGQGSALALRLGFDATDSDGDTVGSSFTVTIKDDNGPSIGSPTSSILTEHTTGTSNTFVAQAASNQTLDVSWGADDNNSGPVNRSVAFAASIHTGDVVHTTGTGSPALTSNGVTVYFYRVSSTEIYGLANDNGGTLDLTGPHPDRQVFHITLSDTNAGSYTFTLLDNIDHAGTGQGSAIGLSLGFVATDADGDTAPSSFAITLNDDTPTVTQGNVSTAVATTDPVDGASSSGTGASLGITWGADDNNSGSFNRSVTFTDASVTAQGDGSTAITTLHSDGQDVHFVLLNGNTQLVAYTGTTVPTSVPADATDAATAHVVFVATVSDADNDGGYAIVQYQELDHDIGTTLFSTITLGFNFTATDADGDTATGTFTTTVNDTSPSIGTSAIGNVSEDDPPGPIAAPLAIDWGADNAAFAGSDHALTFTDGTVAATDPASHAVTLTSYGQAITIGFIGGTLVGYTGATAPLTTADTHVVFFASLSDTTGTYDFTLKQPLDHAAPVGSNDYLDLKFDITATDSDGDTATGAFTVRVDAAGSIGSIDYNNETGGVFVNLDSHDHTYDGQFVAAGRSTDIDGQPRVIGIDNVTGLANAHGGSGDDILVGSSVANNLSGGAGQDLLVVVPDTAPPAASVVFDHGDGTTETIVTGGLASAADNLHGGFGYDTVQLDLDGSAAAGFLFNRTGVAGSPELDGVEQFIGTDKNDVIILPTNYSTDGSGVTVNGGKGDDVISGSNNVDSLFGGEGNDKISGLGGDDDIHGNSGDDQIWGGAGNDTIHGDFGDDTITGGTGDDTLYGDDGNDAFIYKVGDGHDTIDGGAGTSDRLNVNGNNQNQNFVLTAQGGTGFTIEMDADSHPEITAVNVEKLFLAVAGGSDKITIADTDSGIGSDTLSVTGSTGSFIVDGANLPEIHVLNTGSLDFHLVGGSGNDTIDASALNSAATPQTLAVTLDGGDGNDTIIGSTGNDTIIGGTGNDIITGGKGDDTVNAGDDTDTINYTVGDGRDTVDGGAGTDTEIVNGSSSAVTYNVNPITVGADTDIGINIVAGVTSASTIAADAGNYEVATKAVEEIQINLGSAGDHVVVSGDLSGTGLAASTITIKGGAGDDTVDLSQFTPKEDVVFDGAGNGAGGDTVIFGFASNAAGVSLAPIFDSNGHLIGATVTIQGPNGPVTDAFTNVEHFQFTDATLSVGQIFPPTANPVVDAVADTAATEAGHVLASGNAITDVGDSDIDAGTTLSVTAVNGSAAGVGSDVAGSYGTLHLDANGSYSYTAGAALDALPAGQNPSDVFHFTVTDSNGGATTTTLTFSIDGANDTPVGVVDLQTLNDTSAQDAGQAISGTASVLANDTDADTGDTRTVSGIEVLGGSSFTAVSSSGPTVVHGTYGDLAINADGTYTYTPNAAFDALQAGDQKTEVFTYQVADAGGLSSTANLTFSIDGANDAPVGVVDLQTLNDTSAQDAGQAISGTASVLANDTDADTGDTRTVSGIKVSGGSGFSPVSGTSATVVHGTYGDLAIHADGTYTYTPSPLFDDLRAGDHQIEVFTYLVTDAGGLSSAAKLTFSIDGANDTPVGVVDLQTLNDTSAQDAGQAISGTASVLANDSDADTGDTRTVSGIEVLGGSSFTAVSSSGPTVVHGTYGDLAINADGTYTYTPNAAFDALQAGDQKTDVFTYQVADAGGLSSTANLTFSIDGANDAPVVTTATANGAVTEDASFGIPRVELVTNGGFETNNVNGWTLTSVGNQGGYFVSSGGHNSIHAFYANTGLGGGSAHWLLSQDIATQAGVHYTLDFFASNVFATGNMNAMTVTWNGQTVIAVANVYNNGYADYQEYTVDVVGRAGTSALQFDLQAGQYWDLDDISVKAQQGVERSAGSIAFSDAETADQHTVSFSYVGNHGASFTQAGTFAVTKTSDTTNGTGGAADWTFEVADSALQSLAAGQTVTQTYQVTIADGHGGQTTQNVDVTLNGVNDAPVLTASNPNLATIDASQGSFPGQTVASFLGTSISDVDSGALRGIAITGASASHGSWQYSTDGGANWSNFGAYTASSGLLLAGSDLIRFVPDGSTIGSNDTFSYVAWDQTSGTHGSTASTLAGGGSSAFSTVSDTAHLHVTGINQVPVITSALQVIPIAEDGSLQTPVNVVPNGGFESGFSGWTVTTSQAGDTANGTGSTHTGSNAALFRTSSTASDVVHLSESFATVAGAAYTLTFWVSNASFASGNFINVSWDGSTVQTLNNIAATGSFTNFTQFSVNVVGTGRTSALQFDLHNSNYFVLDDVAMKLAPTPGTESATGKITFTDGDFGDTHTVLVTPEVSGYAGNFTAVRATDSTGGGTGVVNWSFTASDSALDFLAADQTAKQFYDVSISDNGSPTGTAMQRVEVDLTGANDAPVATPATPAATVTAYASQTQAPNLVVNPGFEILNPFFPDWNRGNPVAAFLTNSALAHSGSAAAQLVTSQGILVDGTLSQTIATVPGTTYTVSFWLENGNNNTNGAFARDFSASFGGTVLLSLQSAPQFGWTEYTYQVTATASSSNLVFAGRSDASWLIDDVVVTASVESMSGTISFTDVDLTDTHTILPITTHGGNNYVGALTATVGTDSTGGHTGTVNWTYTVGDAAIVSVVAPQQSLDQIYTVTIDDGHGGQTTQDVTVTLTNPDHVPVITQADSARTIVPGISQPTGNLILNGGFENNFNSWHVSAAALNGGVTGLQHSGNLAMTVNSNASGQSSIAAQSFATIAGVHYTVDFWVGNADIDNQPDAFSSSWNGVNLYSTASLPGALGSGAYVEHTFDVVATGSESTLLFTFLHNGQFGYSMLDDVSVTAVPGQDVTQGTITFADVDLGDAHKVSYEPQGSGSDYKGTFTLVESQDSTGVGTGTISWSFVVADSVLASLAPQQRVIQTYTVTIDDGHGGTVSQDVTVTLTNPDHAPVITGHTDGTVQRDVSFEIPAGNALINGGFETGNNTFPPTLPGWTFGGAQTAFLLGGGGLTGQHSGDVALDFGLGASATTVSQTVWTVAGEHYTLDFWVRSQDFGTNNLTVTLGNTTVASFDNFPGNWFGGPYTEETFDIVGTGGAMTLTFTASDPGNGPNTGSGFVLDDVSFTPVQHPTPGTETTSGTVTFTDLDITDTHTVTAQGAGYLGTFTPVVATDSTGGQTGTVNWSFSVADSELSSLAPQLKVQQTYTVTIDDGHGGQTTQDVTVTLTNPDHAPVVTGSTNGTVQEGAPVVAPTGNQIVNGGFESNFDGWSFTNGAQINNGQAHSGGWTYIGFDTRSLSQSFATTVGAAYTVDFWLTNNSGSGPNSAAVIWDGSTVASLTNIQGTNNGFGTVTYTHYSYQVVATHSTTTLSFALHNDASNFLLDDISVAATPPMDTAFGTVSFADIDTIDSHTVSVSYVPGGSGYIGTFTATIASGNDSTGGQPGTLTWTFAASDSQLDFLAAGESEIQTYTVSLNDGHGGTASRDVTVTLTGVNDAPVIAAGAIASLTEQAGQTGSASLDSKTGSLSFTDADVTDSHTASVLGVAATGTTAGLPAANVLLDYLQTGTITESHGVTGTVAWTFSAADSAFDYLAAGQTVTLTYTVQVADNHTGTATQTVAVTITGTNDAAAITGTITGAVLEAGGTANGTAGVPSVSGSLSDTDVDGVANSFQAVATATASTLGYGSYTVDASGNWTYNLNDGNSTVQALTASGQLTDSFVVKTEDGTAQTVTITISGANDAPVNTAPGAATATSGFNLVFSAANSNPISVSDPDSTTLIETLTVSHGTLTLSGVSGLSFTDGDGTADATMTFSGTQSAINAALNGLSYVPATGYSGPDTLQIVSSDTALSDTDAVAITVALNHAPAISPTTQVGGVTEDATPGAATNLITNGGFETGTLAGWTQSGATDFTSVSGSNVHSGSFGLQTGPSSTGFFTQTLSTVAGQTYVIDFWLAEDAGTPASFSASWNGVPLLTRTSGVLLNFTEYTFSVTATGSSSALQFAVFNSPAYFYLDDVSVTGPGPGTELAAGTISFTDADFADTHVVSVTPAVSGYVGTFTPVLTDSTGTGTGSIAWTYSVPDAAIQFLAAGQTLTQTYTVSINDGHGGVSSQDVSVTLHGVNDAPVLSTTTKVALNNEATGSAAPVNGSIPSTATSVSQLVGIGSGPRDVSDADGGAVTGVAIVGSTAASGAWWYSIDNGATWSLIGTVTAANALLLAPSALLYFVPTAVGTANLTFEAWDQTTGTNGTKVDASVTGGTTAFSTGTATASVTVGTVANGALTSGSNTVFLVNGNNVVNGSLLSTGSTLNSSDSLTGGSGTDTFNLTVNSGSTGTQSFDFSAMTKFIGFETVALAANPSRNVNLTFGNANVLSGQTLTVDGSAITTAGRTFTVNASSVNDGGNFIMIAGASTTTSFTGGSGDDTFRLTSAQFAQSGHTLAGGAGTDTIQITSPASIVNAAFTGVSGVERLQLGDFANSVTLAALASTAVGGAGGVLTIDDLAAITATSNLTVNGSAFTGNLLVLTGAGSDTLTGGSGNDTFSFTTGHLTSTDTVNGNGGTDTIRITDAASVTDAAFNHVSGVEVLQLGDFTNNVTLGSLAGTAIATATNATLTIDDTAAGSGHGLTVDATGLATSAHLNVLGGAANDLIELLNAHFGPSESINGGGGVDILRIMDAASIADTSFAHVSNLETIQLGDFVNSMVLGVNASTVIGTGTLTIDDTAATSPASSLTIDGSGVGPSAHLTILGGAGHDNLIGGAGDDTIAGGTGNDTLKGGAGADIFVFAEQGAANLDRILDFSGTEGDKIDISALLGAAQGAADTGNVANYVHFAASGNDVVLQVDTSGSGTFSGGSHDVVTLANFAASNQHVVDVVFASHDHQVAAA